MSALYVLSYNSLNTLLVLLILAVILQASGIIYDFFRFQYRRNHIGKTLLEILVLCYLLLLTACLAETIYQATGGFLLNNQFATLRFILFACMAILSLSLVLNKKRLVFLDVPLIASLTLPVVEHMSTKAFPFIFAGAIVFWILRAANNLRIFHERSRGSLSAFFVKEAVDTLDFGLLFWRTDGLSNGQILLSNQKMQELGFALTGKSIQNGKDFYELLQTGKVLPNCHKSAIESHLIYTLPDKSAWEFELKYIYVRKRRCALVIASDTTKKWQAIQQLYTQSRELELRNKSLKEMLKNLETASKIEERIRLKEQIHDTLGQKISLLLRSVREHEKLDKTLLASFSNNFLTELQKTPVCHEYSLDTLVKDFESLGVNVHALGRLPENKELQKTFFEISTEAISNAIRHGYATEIFINIGYTEKVWKLHITDNGLANSKPIVEGGGLHEMRRKVSELNGTLEYGMNPHFFIAAEISEEELL